jgi:hypothetical protein
VYLWQMPTTKATSFSGGGAVNLCHTSSECAICISILGMIKFLLLKLMYINYSLRPKILVVLVLGFYVYIQTDNDESRHIQNTCIKNCMNLLISKTTTILGRRKYLDMDGHHQHILLNKWLTNYATYKK